MGQSQYYSIAGPVLTATLPAGAPSAFATTWYDQSGNGFDVTQATAASQPRIINVGLIDQQKNRPCLFFDGVASQMTNAAYNLLLNSQTPTWNAVIWPIATNNAFAAIASWRSGGGVASQLELGGNNNWNTCWWSNNVNWTTINGTSIANGTFQILTALTNATSTQMYFNGSLSFNNTGQSNVASTAGNPANGNTTSLVIGNDNCCGGRFIKGYIPEIVLSSNYFSTIDRQYLEWSQAQYYTVSGPALVNVPASAPSASIMTWYDQSGNGINLQATGSRQPKIMNVGIITRLGLAGTWPTIQGNNASQTNLTATFAATYGGAALSANSVLQADVNSNANLRVLSFGNSALTTADWSNVNYCNINQRNNNQFVIERNGVNPATTFVVATPLVLSARFDGANRQLFNNGTGSATFADANSFSFNALRLLQSINPAFEAGEAITGKMSEFNLFYSALNTTRRTLQETNQSAYYNIAISNSKYTPPSATTYNRFVLGIGRELATDSVGATRASAGMGFTVSTAAGDYLKDNGDYMTAGINCAITSSTNVTFLPAPILLRWDNDWYVNKTDVNANNGTLSFYFDFGDYFIGTSPGPAANYSLLARGSTASNFSVVPGTIPSVVGDRVYFSLNASTIANTGYYTIGSINPPVSPLPIELLNFDATVCQKDVCIDWSTASEINTDYFSIERSSDAQNFTEIKKVKGAGNSLRKLNYSAIDYEPLPGTSYYRLKQVDINQNFTYTKIDAVEFKDELAVGIYPNPSTGELSISNCKNYDKLYVADLLGRTVYSTDVSKENMNLDLNSLPVGQYFITLINLGTSKKYTSKLIIDKKQ